MSNYRMKESDFDTKWSLIAGVTEMDHYYETD